MAKYLTSRSPIQPCLLRSPPYWSGSIVILRVSKEAFAFTPNRLRVAIHERLRDAGVGGLCP